MGPLVRSGARSLRVTQPNITEDFRLRKLAWFDGGRCFDSVPEFLDACAGFGGDGKDFIQFKGVSDGQEVSGARVAAEPICLGCDHQKRAAGMAEPVEELSVVWLRRDVGVYETNAEFESLALGKIRIDKLRPFGGDGF